MPNPLTCESGTKAMTALPWQVHWMLFRHTPLRTIRMWLRKAWYRFVLPRDPYVLSRIGRVSRLREEKRQAQQRFGDAKD